MTYFEKRPGDKSTRLHHSSFNIFQSCWSIRLHCAFNWLEKYSDYYRYRYNPRNCLWVIYEATKSQRYAPVAECKRWPKKKKMAGVSNWLVFYYCVDPNSCHTAAWQELPPHFFFFINNFLTDYTRFLTVWCFEQQTDSNCSTLHYQRLMLVPQLFDKLLFNTFVGDLNWCFIFSVLSILALVIFPWCRLKPIQRRQKLL